MDYYKRTYNADSGKNIIKLRINCGLVDWVHKMRQCLIIVWHNILYSSENDIDFESEEEHVGYNQEVVLIHQKVINNPVKPQ